MWKNKMDNENAKVMMKCKRNEMDDEDQKVIIKNVKKWKMLKMQKW